MSENEIEEGNSFRTGVSAKPDDLALHVLHALDQPIGIVDAADSFLFMNKAYAAQYGLGLETVRGQSISEVMGADIYEKRLKVLLQRARSDGQATFRGWIEFPETGRRYIEADLREYKHPGLVDKDCLILQFRDVTEREELDLRRRKSLDFQEDLLGRIPAMVWISGEDGIPYFYNESWLNFTGSTLVEQVREGWSGMVHPDDRQQVMDRIQYAIGNREVVQLEFRLRHLMGGYRWVRLSGRPAEPEAEGKTDFIVSALNIDDSRKRVEVMRQDLEEARHLREQALLQKAAADKANREKSAYLSLASHEIRTPMNPVIGFADLLASDPNLDGDSKEMAQMILKAGKNLLKLLDEVLDYAKIEAGALKLSPEPTDVHDLLMEIDNLYAFDAKSRGIELRVKDNVEGDTELYQDRLRLQQVLGTLITNSIRFTHTGHVDLEAAVEKVRLNGGHVQMLKFTLSDTGVGMKPEQVDKLFEPFARAETEFAEKYSGAGLGLAIAQKLVDAMHGTISVQSEEGKGTTIELTIPFSPVPEHLQRPKTRRKKHSGSPEEGAEEKATVMVVDDEKSSLEVNSSLMHFLGYVCDTTENGRELLEQLKRQNYEIILMDLMMPGVDGYEATRRIRDGDCGEVNREAYIIAVTGCVADEDRERAYKSGINAFVNKPLTIQDLKEAIKAYKSMGRSS
ncbi:response regulator [Puniceicoccales bacterium CK1056]|uniref:histidine kinase n=1 Tax=Oceanipulchritudo coccoides TaxID=2706888 RepID=A0A6B2M020_9BACT|nr:hybrid sensor histidine kinase/response regulator [Oceanipulchritudo coccoides]NDV61752.1 response regulator [Oceanipulchritudo coccoides]